MKVKEEEEWCLQPRALLTTRLTGPDFKIIIMIMVFVSTHRNLHDSQIALTYSVLTRIHLRGALYDYIVVKDIVSTSKT